MSKILLLFPPTWTNLAPTWSNLAQLVPTWPQLGPNLVPSCPKFVQLGSKSHPNPVSEPHFVTIFVILPKSTKNIEKRWFSYSFDIFGALGNRNFWTQLGHLLTFCYTYMWMPVWVCHLAPTWPHLGPILAQLAPTWTQLGPNLAQLSPNLAQLGPSLAQLGRNLAQLGPTWLHLAPLGLNLAPKTKKPYLESGQEPPRAPQELPKSPQEPDFGRFLVDFWWNFDNFFVH